jgi:cytochrome P450
MTETTAAMLERWQSVARRGEPLDIGAEMMRLTLSVIVKTMLGAEASDEAEARVVARALNITLEHLHGRAWALIKLPEHWPSPGNRCFRQAVDTLDKIVYRIIDEHRRQEENTNDLLSILLLARDEETGEGMSDQQLRDEVMTAFTAGHETTANALAWTWYLLAHHPHVAARLQTELATVLGGRSPTFRDLSNLNYTRQVIEEAMRLYPPLWITGRLSVNEDEIGGYHIPANADLVLSPYVTHRHPAFWEQPEVFDPDRFTPERSAGRPRYAYFPFGGGPHQCIGNHFALIEAQVILAMVAQTYRLDLVPGQSIKPRPMIALKPHPRILMTLHPQPTAQLS